MPLYDHQCPSCGKIFEAIEHVDCDSSMCACGAMAKRIISCGKCYTANEDADWLKSVTDIINRDTTNPVAKEFIKNPTRSNYRAWMKSEGLRPLERNEPVKPPPVDLEGVKRQVWENFQRRHRISI